MFVRSIFASYNKLLAGIVLAVLAIALAGCNELAAEKVAPSRPVLVATVHYEAESPERRTSSSPSVTSTTSPERT